MDAACYAGHDKVVERLLDSGASLNPQPSGLYTRFRTPLYQACHGGRIETVKMLLDRGADVNLPSKPWTGTKLLSPLHGATNCLVPGYTGKGYLPGLSGREKEAIRDKLVRLLLDAGANPQDPPALHQAAELNQEGVVRMLIKAGINVNAEPPQEDDTILSMAAKNGHSNIVSMLLDADANGEQSLALALFRATQAEDESIVRRLLAAGGGTGTTLPDESEYRPALGIAADAGNLTLVKLLLDAGANPNGYAGNDEDSEEENEDDWPPTPLEEACGKGYTEIVEALLDAGADVDRGAHGSVALRAAAAHGRDAVVHLLIDRGASVDSPLPERTALQDAAQFGRLSTVKILLDAGADINRTGDVGGIRTAIEAVHRGEADDMELVIRESARK